MVSLLDLETGDLSSVCLLAFLGGFGVFIFARATKGLTWHTLAHLLQ